MFAVVIGKFRRFREDESGAITAFVAVVFLMMFVAAGMAIDFMRHETYRTELQSAVDRGVLAAASLNQTKDPEQTVRQYIRSANFVEDQYKLKFKEEKSLGSRKITAQASYTLPTYFLKVVGINSLDVSAVGVAYEGVSNIEVSLALDISGSMARERTAVTENSLSLINNYGFPGALSWQQQQDNVTRLDLVRVAASEFIDLILNASNKDTTTVSLIPFAGQVNVGDEVFSALADEQRHEFSKCIDMTDSDFRTTKLPGRKSRKHTAHFQWFVFEGDDGHNAEWGWCPSDEQEIEYLSNDASKLKKRLSKLVGHDGTGTQVGMKWALGLLDPTSNGLVKELASKDIVEDEFDDRPGSFKQSGTMKVVVLMTDGNTTRQKRPKHNTLPPGLAKKEDADKYKWANDLLQHHKRDSVETATEQAARDDLKRLCQYAEDNEVVVFTIGFDIAKDSNAYQDLLACASEEAFFFDVNGPKLNDAFTAIASTITRLRLMQ